MAYFFNVGIFSLIVLVFCSSSVHPAPHIIGAGWNTDIGGVAESSQVGRSFLRSVLPSLRQPYNHDNPSSKVDTQVFSESIVEGQNNSEVNENRSDRQMENVDLMTGIRTPPPVISSAEQRGSFVRQKREACRIPANLAMNQLKNHLNSTQYIGRIRSQPIRPRVPSDQPDSCSNESNKWWPKTEVNLRSNCPWRYVETYLGETAYPRYIIEAECLCVPCINSTSMECQKLHQNITYFEHTGCLNGLALMTKVTRPIVVGCFCAHPPPQKATEAVTTTSTLPSHDD